ncbi:hypothetical protein C8J56DRAFT_1025133 [Mycena floridula]|nr:hypothetical protein C8J56DRAFT_1031383 [Mycena floridula]KAJ7589736.1 hypothetical protein C8J56DRAFT_1025133 [Mycena floridula]
MKFFSASFLVAVVAATSVSAGLLPRCGVEGCGVDGQKTVDIVPGLTLAEFCLEFTGACLAIATTQASGQEPTAFCVQGPVPTVCHQFLCVVGFPDNCQQQANILCFAPRTPLFTDNIAGYLFAAHKTTLP